MFSSCRGGGGGRGREDAYNNGATFTLIDTYWERFVALNSCRRSRGRLLPRRLLQAPPRTSLGVAPPPRKAIPPKGGWDEATMKRVEAVKQR
ncbi:hypothetical protein E2562_027997 [Oryza meyeriana var. granulata]|uniref:Uncharacterized protein n=1 Tax=Oryza meyeriana var. granulata TaxID=110450 RepID=A0A6G1CU27_9ORYZ|nr:hypothetical protein E2562_027997 [Oryza meyeriana var. granulata]